MRTLETPEEKKEVQNEASVLILIKTLLYSWIKEAVSDAFQEQLSKDCYHYPEKVTVIQASEITGYSKNSIYQLHSKGRIPGALKIGGKLVFDTKTLRDWVENSNK